MKFREIDGRSLTSCVSVNLVTVRHGEIYDGNTKFRVIIPRNVTVPWNSHVRTHISKRHFIWS